MTAHSSRRPVHARAPGKINVFFAVGALAADGYHPVASVYQAVDCVEDVRARAADEFTIAVTGDVDVSGVPLDESNLALRAARLVTHTVGYEGGIHLEVHKGVPVAGGMGGGSADAAAALVAVNELTGGGLTARQLHDLGAGLGADVPFSLLGGTALGTGHGDRLAPALAVGAFHWVLVTSGEGLSTPEVYRELDRLRDVPDISPDYADPRVDPSVLQALRSGDAGALAVSMRNDLQPAALSLRPHLADTLDAGMTAGALAGIVSGSGPTCAFLAADSADADAVVDRLAAQGLHAFHVHAPVAGARLIGG